MYFRSEDDVRECDDVRVELMPFIQSQYASSTRIVSILQSNKNHILPDADIELFYNCMFNLETAIGYGLDVWGNIIGVSRYIPEVIINQGEIIRTGNKLTLGDDDFKRIIWCKAASNIMDSTMYSLNYLLLKLFPDYRCYVRLSVDPMVITYVFLDKVLTTLELSIFATFADYNRGAGVGWNLLEFEQDKVFGFKDSELQPFDQGTFYLSIGGA